jgi:hypothetical protein
MLVERLYSPGPEHSASFPGSRIGIVEASVAAGALHDVGKTLFNLVGRRKVERILQGEEGSLTFPYHEILSAALAGYALWRLNYETPVIASILRPILLHHQGLRGVSTEWMEKGFREIGARLSDPETSRELGSLAANVLEEAARLLGKTGSWRQAIDIIMEIAGFYRRGASAEEALEESRGLMSSWLSQGFREQESAAVREAVRVATGLVMAADNLVAASASLECPSSSVYVRELARLGKAAGLPQEPIEGCILRLDKLLASR